MKVEVWDDVSRNITVLSGGLALGLGFCELLFFRIEEFVELLKKGDIRFDFGTCHAKIGSVAVATGNE